MTQSVFNVLSFLFFKIDSIVNLKLTEIFDISYVDMPIAEICPVTMVIAYDALSDSEHNTSIYTFLKRDSLPIFLNSNYAID